MTDLQARLDEATEKKEKLEGEMEKVKAEKESLQSAVDPTRLLEKASRAERKWESKRKRTEQEFGVGYVSYVLMLLSTYERMRRSPISELFSTIASKDLCSDRLK